MPLTFAFDVYGTLIDTAGITQSLNRLAGDQAPLFSSRWRDKQPGTRSAAGSCGFFRLDPAVYRHFPARSRANHFAPWDRQPDLNLSSMSELQRAFNG